MHTHGDAFAELEIAFAGELPQEFRASLDGALRLVPELEPRWRVRGARADEFFPRGLLRAGRYLDLEVGFALAIPEDWRFILPGDPLELTLEESCGAAHRERPLRASFQARRVAPDEQMRRRERLAAAWEGEAVELLPSALGEILTCSTREQRLGSDQEVELEVERMMAWLGCGEWMLRFDLRGIACSREELGAELERLLEGLTLLPAEELAAHRAEHRRWLARPEVDPESAYTPESSLQRGHFVHFAAGWSFRRRLADTFFLELWPGDGGLDLVGWDPRRELRFELRTRATALELDAAHREALGAAAERTSIDSGYGPGGRALFSRLEVDAASERAWGCAIQRELATLTLRDGRYVELRLEGPAPHFADDQPSARREILQRLLFEPEPLSVFAEHGQGWIDWRSGYALLPPESDWRRAGNTNDWLMMAGRSTLVRVRPVRFGGFLGASERRREELELLAHSIVALGADTTGSSTRSLGAGWLGELPARGLALDLGPEGRKFAAEIWMAWQGNQLHRFLISGRPGEPLAARLSLLARSIFRNF